MARNIISNILFASLLVAGAAVASPALEYGPEAEARFLQRCEDSSSVDPAGCRRLNERLQSALGYEAYLAHADGGPEAFARANGGPEAFARQSTSRCLVADALRHDEPGCGTRAAALVDR
jgi:hypothetical protein